ncbi:hypothetical protein C8Q73DRAFT_189883 [Cubamyces lactineus]|nr:hypothetical protein C8Q73DRAFT_189883 [Cubamyces lactineus]
MRNRTLQSNAIARRDANLSTCAQTCIDNSLGQDLCNSTCGLLCVCKDVAAWPPITTCLLTQCPTTDVASFQGAMSSCALWIANCPPSTDASVSTASMQGESTLGTLVPTGAPTTSATPAPIKTTSKVTQWSSSVEWRASLPTPTSASQAGNLTDTAQTITSAPTLSSTTISTSSNFCSSPGTSTLTVSAAQNDTIHETSSGNPVIISSATLGAALFVTLLLTLYLYVHRHYRQVDAQSMSTQPLTITFTSDDVSRLRERERSWTESRDEGRNALPRVSVSSTYWSSSSMAPSQRPSDIVPSAVAASAGSLPPSYRATMSGLNSRAHLYGTLFSRESASLSPCHERRESSITRDEPIDHEDDGEPSSYHSTRTRPSTRLSEPHPVHATPARQVDADVSPLESVSEFASRRYLPVLVQESEDGRSEVPPPYE